MQRLIKPKKPKKPRIKNIRIHANFKKARKPRTKKEPIFKQINNSNIQEIKSDPVTFVTKRKGGRPKGGTNKVRKVSFKGKNSTQRLRETSRYLNQQNKSEIIARNPNKTQEQFKRDLLQESVRNYYITKEKKLAKKEGRKYSYSNVQKKLENLRTYQDIKNVVNKNPSILNKKNLDKSFNDIVYKDNKVDINPYFSKSDLLKYNLFKLYSKNALNGLARDLKNRGSSIKNVEVRSLKLDEDKRVVGVQPTVYQFFDKSTGKLLGVLGNLKQTENNKQNLKSFQDLELKEKGIDMNNIFAGTADNTTLIGLNDSLDNAVLNMGNSELNKILEEESLSDDYDDYGGGVYLPMWFDIETGENADNVYTAMNDWFNFKSKWK